MRKLVWLLLALPQFTSAQGGGCAITLLSDSSTLFQSWCLATPSATIDPVMFLVEGTGVQVSNLPPGVTAVLANDTLTISGTITTESVNFLEVTTSEGCSSPLISLFMSVIVDPGFSCSVVGEDVVLHWPGMNASLEWGDFFFVTCTSADGFSDVQAVFLPWPDSLVWSGLPTDTELTFFLEDGVGLPYCFPGSYQTSCTIITTEIIDHSEEGPGVCVVTHEDRIELSAPAELREVWIYDMLGSLVATHAMNARTASIAVPSLVPGAYLLRVVATDGSVSVQRFIRE